MMFRKYWPILLLFLLVQLGFLILQNQYQNYFLDDSSEYLKTAENIVYEGQIYCGDLNQPVDLGLYTKRTPGYPLLLALSSLLTVNILPILILQNLLSLFVFILMLKIFKPDRKFSIILFLMVILFPAQFIYPNLIMSETLFQFTIMLAMWSVWSYFRIDQLKYLWSYQFLLIIAILIKPVMYLFIIPNILFFIYLYFKTRNRLNIIASLIPLVFVILFAGINQMRTGLFHVSSIQQVNLVDYNLYYFKMQQVGPDRALEIKDSVYAACSGKLEFADYSMCLSKSAGELLKEDLFSYGIFHLKGMLRYFIDPGRFDIYHFFGIQNSGGKGFLYYLNQGGIKAAWSYLWDQPTLIVIWIILIAFMNFIRTAGFLMYTFNRKFKIEFRILLFLLIGTLAFATGPLGASRFMLPISLLVTGSAVVQYSYLFEKIRERLISRRKKDVTLTG